MALCDCHDEYTEWHPVNLEQPGWLDKDHHVGVLKEPVNVRRVKMVVAGFAVYLIDYQAYNLARTLERIAENNGRT